MLAPDTRAGGGAPEMVVYPPSQPVEHVFWGCTGAREVRRVLQRQLPQGVELLPKHVWVLEPPATELHPLVWAAVCLATLTVMLSVSKQLQWLQRDAQLSG